MVDSAFFSQIIFIFLVSNVPDGNAFCAPIIFPIFSCLNVPESNKCPRVTLCYLSDFPSDMNAEVVMWLETVLLHKKTYSVPSS